MGFFQQRKLKRLLDGCDLSLAAAVMANQFYGSVIPKELAKLVNTFVDLPNIENAVALLRFDPQFALAFEECRPGGLYVRLGVPERKIQDEIEPLFGDDLLDDEDLATP